MSAPSVPLTTLIDDLSEPEWTKTFLSVPNEQEQVVPFVYDQLQLKMAAEQTRRDVWVKPRQVRCSSRIMARNVRRVTRNFGTHCLVICKDDDMVGRFRYRIKSHIEQLAVRGQAPEITIENSDELVFGGLEGSRFIWASSEQKVAGRSFTAHILHASEVAHWGPNAGEILGGILPAIPEPPFGQVDLESTPNGAMGPFYEFAMAAKWMGTNQEDDYQLHFTHWWEEPKYALPINEEILKSFTPSDDERKLMQTANLSIGQILWRRRTQRNMSKTGTPFEQEYPEDLLGCFLLGGASYFESEALKWHNDNASKPVLVLNQIDNEGVKFEGWGEARPGRPAMWVANQLIVFELPQQGQEYVVFVDPTEGHKNSDNGAIQVMHARSRRQVATLALKATPNRLGEMACAIGKYYNNALLAIERNRISAAVLKALDLGYPNLYYDADEEDPTREKRKAGWYTNRDNRMRALSKFKEDVEDYTITIRDTSTVREMYQFTWEQVRKRGEMQWKAQAQEGAKDDRVIAIAGANFLCDQVISVPRRREVDQSVRQTAPWI